MRDIIPIMHCFDNNYVIPAAVSFYSMLANSSCDYFYKLYVLHDNITEDNQKRLSKIVENFDNATLEFVDTKGLFSDLFAARGKTSFSKEVFYKFLPPSYFPQYDKIIITDVDVVFCGDIAEEFIKFDIEECDSENYVAGNARHFESYDMDLHAIVDENERRYYSEVLAGYWIFNLKKMRQNDMEKKFVEYAWKNAKSLFNPEQEVVNRLCYPYIKILPPNTIVPASMYEIDRFADGSSLATMYAEAKSNPLQIHFSEARGKVWNKVCTPKWDVWMGYLKKTSYYFDYIYNLQKAIEESDSIIKVFSIKVPFRKRFFSIWYSGLRESKKTKMLHTKESE